MASPSIIDHNQKFLHLDLNHFFFNCSTKSLWFFQNLFELDLESLFAIFITRQMSDEAKNDNLWKC